MDVTRRIAIVVACATLAATPALAQARREPRRDPGVSGPVSGTLAINARGAAAGIGYTWGDGSLRYGGRVYRFTVNGVSIADIGFSRVRGTGRVYNLHRLQDFSGTYVAASGQATLVEGIGGQVLKNSNGVEIRVDNVTRGARLQGSADGIKLTLR